LIVAKSAMRGAPTRRRDLGQFDVRVPCPAQACATARNIRKKAAQDLENPGRKDDRGSSFSKGTLQSDICRFESSMPSQAMRSPTLTAPGPSFRRSVGLPGRDARAPRRQGSQVKGGLDPQRFTMSTVPAMLAKSNPWHDYCDGGRSLKSAIEKLVKKLLLIPVANSFQR
jgi:hypothetical protein